MTVVGARRASSYGREVARELARELAAAGQVVVSGLAFGIDACAHRGALEGGGLTVAVLGCGADVSYPAAHRSLWRRVGELGLVLSELPPGTGAWRWTFPARNRIMAALAGMTVVVEAAERSGSLITADLAADLGRDLGAVPGPVGSRLSAGPNHLLAGGACVVRDAQDVLDAMLGAGARPLDRIGPAARAGARRGPRSGGAGGGDERRGRRRARPRRRRGRGGPGHARVARLRDLLARRGLPADHAEGAGIGCTRVPSEQSRKSIPAVLSIAGSDSGGGAGIQADLKAFARCGVHGMTAITAITAQNTVGVSAVEAVSPELIVAQVRSVAEDIGVDAVKIGMLGTAETVRRRGRGARPARGRRRSSSTR